MNDLFIIISNVHLDRTEIIKALKKMFEGFSQSPPKAFVFCGNFTYEKLRYTLFDLKKLKFCFNKLGTLITQFSSIRKKSLFIFLPGQSDPGLGNELPIPNFLKYVTSNIR